MPAMIAKATIVEVQFTKVSLQINAIEERGRRLWIVAPTEAGGALSHPFPGSRISGQPIGFMRLLSTALF